MIICDEIKHHFEHLLGGRQTLFDVWLDAAWSSTSAQHEWSIHQHDCMGAAHSQHRDLTSEDRYQTGGIDSAREEYRKLSLQLGYLFVQIRGSLYLLLLTDLAQELLVLRSLSHNASQFRVEY